jgi:1-acyl-sn-glycerol-3-phosphate acyltransferase
VLGHLPADFRVIHKRSLYVLPVVGLHLYLAGHVGIDRGNPFRARRSLERAAERIRGGTSVVVFPEGTRSRDEAVRAFKRGPFVLAAKAEVPVVPLSLVGVKRVVPGGLIGLRPGTVELRIHPPLATSGRPARDAAALAAEVRQIVARGCGQA